MDFGRRTKSGVAELPTDFQSRLLEGLSASELNAIVGVARQRRLSINQVLQHEGEPASNFSLVITGLAGFYKITPKGRKLFLRWIAPGEVFGLTALQRDIQPCLTTVHGLQAGSLLVWERGTMRALVEQVPRLRENVFAITAEYFASILDVVVVRASMAAHQRLALMLIESARQIGSREKNGLQIAVTNEQMADMADVSHFTVSRHLSDWQRHGILTKRRGRILLQNLEALVDLLS